MLCNDRERHITRIDILSRTLGKRAGTATQDTLTWKPLKGFHAVPAQGLSILLDLSRPPEPPQDLPETSRDLLRPPETYSRPPETSRDLLETSRDLQLRFDNKVLPLREMTSSFCKHKAERCSGNKLRPDDKVLPCGRHLGRCWVAAAHGAAARCCGENRDAATCLSV